MRVVVSGASGNLGTALLRAMQGRGHEVHALVRRPPPPQGVYAEARWTAVDLSRDESRAVLRGALQGADAYLHLAWALQPMRRPGYLHRAGPLMLHRCVQEAMTVGVPQLVHVSSVAAYAPRRSEALVDERWPVAGVPSSTYSRDKAAGERVLDVLLRQRPDRSRVAVLRPCLIAQYAAGGAMLRCGTPLVLPGRVLRHAPALPFDPRFGIQLVHAADVADAALRAMERGAQGQFNIAGEPVVRGRDILDALRARPVRLDSARTRRLLAAAWAARLSPLDPGWVDMALQCPWMDTTRARRDLAWQPAHDAREVLVELVAGMAEGAGTESAALRPRGLGDGLRSLLRGTVPRREAT
ncbi:NAD-dependent epimerase/dehydratase family protein [Pedococcus sp. 5OH_020]|uniref:NAD-dependent epimerase/dehydratase family protein n=1 Tax=Pedococcus sp. 5OH_020 TaxID=2989814 RepID=UPI0022EA017F|nr:NAD-dependent epimerase/dehydratase family protein [Pedococcus sp. 5OH_020]